MKKILLLICFALFGFEAIGQVVINGQVYIDRYVNPTLLLDSFPNAAAAYSLRKLNTDYYGPCVTVRRSSDNAVSSFGFVNNYLDTTSLKTFCGAGATDSCFVQIWYDQSGNTRNGIQSTNAFQPQILRGGVIFYQNGEPALRFDGVNNFLQGPTSNILTATNPVLSVFSVAQKNTTITTPNSAGAIIAFGDLSPQRLYLIRVDGNEVIRTYIQSNSETRQIISTTNWSRNQFLYTSIDNGTNLNGYQNNTQVLTNQTTTIGTFGSDYGYNIGKTEADGTGYWIGSQQELIFYLSDQTSNRITIQNNINRFYSIY